MPRTNNGYFPTGAPVVPEGYVGTGLSYQSSDNPMYDAYYKANPYVNQTYKMTLADRLFGGLFRTGYDKWLNEMQLNAAQYDAGIVDMEQQNIFNSPAEQADRMRAAGLNPDLLGTGDVAEGAKMNPDVQDAQIPDAGANLSAVSAFAGMLSSCFQGAFAMAKEGISLFGALTDIEGQNIVNANGMQELAMNTIRRNIPAEGFKTDSDYLAWLDGLNQGISPDLKWSQSLAYSLGLGRRQRKMFEETYRTAIGSLPAELERFKMENELADNKLQSVRKTSSSFYDQSIEVMTESNKILVEQSDELQKVVSQNKLAEQNVVSSELENRGVESDIQGQYLDALNTADIGAKRAQNEIEQADLIGMQNRIDKILKDTRTKLLHMYERMANEGNSFATYMIHNMMLHEYMNFDFKAKGEFGIGKVLPKTMQGWLPSLGADMEFGASM